MVTFDMRHVVLRRIVENNGRILYVTNGTEELLIDDCGSALYVSDGIADAAKKEGARIITGWFSMVVTKSVGEFEIKHNRIALKNAVCSPVCLKDVSITYFREQVNDRLDVPVKSSIYTKAVEFLDHLGFTIGEFIYPTKLDLIIKNQAILLRTLISRVVEGTASYELLIPEEVVVPGEGSDVEPVTVRELIALRELLQAFDEAATLGFGKSFNID